MPTFPIDGVEWTFSHDLSDTGAAARYNVTYEKMTAARIWDPAYFNTIKPYRGEANPDLVEVFVEVDGNRELLVQGVVDRSGRTGIPTRGQLSGRDLMAQVLDRYPTVAFEIKGGEVDASGNIVYNKTFITAVQQLLIAAGVAYYIEGVLDYKLGSPIAVSTDRSFGEVFAELLDPLRWSEKHAVDAWFDGGRLYIVGRDTNFRGTIQVDAARIFADEFEKTALPSASDVRVEGWTYQKPVDDIPLSQTPGMAWTEPWTNQPQKRTVTLFASGKQESYEVDEIEYYNVRGQLYSSYKKKLYLTKTRVEERTKTIVFDEDPTRVTYGSPQSETEQFKLTDIVGANRIQDELISDIRRKWTYYSDNGDVRTMDEFEAKKAETGISPLAIEKMISRTELYRRSAGHIVREYEVVEMDDVGTVIRTQGVSDLGPFKLPSYGGGAPVATAGRKMESTTFAAGSAGSPAKYKSDLLGDQASVDQLRTWLLEERGLIREQVSFTMAPKLDVKLACRLDVLNPPAYWDASTGFFVLSLRVRRDSVGARMEVEAVRWLAA